MDSSLCRLMLLFQWPVIMVFIMQAMLVIAQRPPPWPGLPFHVGSGNSYSSYPSVSNLYSNDVFSEQQNSLVDDPFWRKLATDAQDSIKSSGSNAAPAEITYDSYNVAFPALLNPWKQINYYWPNAKLKAMTKQDAIQRPHIRSFWAKRRNNANKKQNAATDANNMDNFDATVVGVDDDDANAISSAQRRQQRQKHVPQQAMKMAATATEKPLAYDVNYSINSFANVDDYADEQLEQQFENEFDTQHQPDSELERAEKTKERFEDGAVFSKWPLAEPSKNPAFWADRQAYPNALLRFVARNLKQNSVICAQDQASKPKRGFNLHPFILRSIIRGSKREKPVTVENRQEKQFFPSISAGAMTNLGHFFKDLKTNVKFMENQEIGTGAKKLIKGDHAIGILQEQLLKSAEEGRPSAEAAAFLHAIRTYRPSQKIRSLVAMNPEGYHGSQFIDPNYMWVGLGK